VLVAPKPWQGPDDGGYYLSIGTATSIVIGGHRSAVAVRKSLAAQPETAALVYRALDKLGQTGWRINRAVLEVATTARDTGVSLPGLPQPPERIEPRRPADIDTNAAARQAWRQAKARHIEAHLADVGRVLQAHIALNEDEAFADEQAIYFPHHCDFRGRIYPMPTALNIQGNDLARSLLEFADGLPIDSDEAEGWLAAHTAKMFGQGRRSFEDRIAWTRANEPLLRQIAEDPLGNRREWEGLPMSCGWDLRPRRIGRLTGSKALVSSHACRVSSMALVMACSIFRRSQATRNWRHWSMSLPPIRHRTLSGRCRSGISHRRSKGRLSRRLGVALEWAPQWPSPS